MRAYATDRGCTSLARLTKQSFDDKGVPKLELGNERKKMAIGERSTHTGLLKQEFARADVLVKNRLDGLVRQFEETDATFVANYRNARKITDTGSQPKPPAVPPGP